MSDHLGCDGEMEHWCDQPQIAALGDDFRCPECGRVWKSVQVSQIPGVRGLKPGTKGWTSRGGAE